MERTPHTSNVMRATGPVYPRKLCLSTLGSHVIKIKKTDDCFVFKFRSASQFILKDNSEVYMCLEKKIIKWVVLDNIYSVHSFDDHAKFPQPLIKILDLLRRTMIQLSPEWDDYLQFLSEQVFPQNKKERPSIRK